MTDVATRRPIVHLLDREQRDSVFARIKALSASATAQASCASTPGKPSIQPPGK